MCSKLHGQLVWRGHKRDSNCKRMGFKSHLLVCPHALSSHIRNTTPPTNRVAPAVSRQHYCSFLPLPKHLGPTHHEEQKYEPFYLYTRTHSAGDFNRALKERLPHQNTPIYHNNYLELWTEYKPLCLPSDLSTVNISLECFSATEGSRGSSSLSTSRSHGSADRVNPHGLGWTGSSSRSPSKSNHSVVPQGPTPTHQGTAHVGFGDWFD